jgi:beta-xylosidase
MSPSPCPVRLRRGTASGAVLALLCGLLLLLPSTAVALATPTATDVTDGLLLSYDLTQGSGTTVTDTSGHGRDGTVNGGATRTSSGLSLDGVDDYVKLPDNLMTGLSAITVSADVYVATDQATPFFLWGLGNTASGSSGTGYLMASGNAFRAAITTTNWSGEKVTARSSGGNLARGVWKTVTYTQTGTTGTLYEDGAQVGQNTAVTVLPSQVGAGVTTNNLLGKSNYATDHTLKGKVRAFRVYDRALTPTEVASISLTDANRVSSDVAALDLGDLSGVTADLSLPTTGEYGSSISWASSDPVHIAADGAVTRPGPSEDPVEVTLTATLTRGGSSDTKTFVATVLPDVSDQTKADAAAAALAIVGPDDVRGNLTLASTGSYDAVVTWASSDPAVVGSDGVVHRPAHGDGDAKVTMTGTATVGTAAATKDIVLTVRELPEAAPYTGYAFSYFTGNTIAGEKIYMAASKGNNALSWVTTNGDNPILTSTMGTKGLRDPFMIRSPEGDTFYMLATDLSIGSGTSWGDAQTNGSRYLEVWESHDLIHWGEQRHVLVAPDGAGDAWAPEASWDADLGSYVVYWASNMTINGKTYHRIYYATTRDFRTFGKPVLWQDPGTSVIDTDVLKEGGTYYRFTKDEGSSTGCSDIIQEKSTNLLAVDDISDPTYDPNNRKWQKVASCIGKNAGTSAVEGPTAFKANPGDTSGHQYYLFVDEYGGRGYIPLATDDLDNPGWSVPSSYNLPASPRHGTVLPVTAAELKALRQTPDPLSATADGLVLRYPLDQTSGTTVTDASGNGHDGTLVNGGAWTDGALTLDGTNDFVDLPDNAMAGMDAITVSMDVRIDPAQATPYFIWGLGNTDSSGTGNGYLFTTGNNYRTSIATGNWTTEQTVTSGSALARDTWKTLTYTLGNGTATLYLDGIQVAQKTGVTTLPGDIGDGQTTANYIGRSMYSSDRFLKGQVRDFRLYNRALSGQEVAGLGSNATAISSVTLDSLKVPAIITGDTDTVTLPVKPGTDLTTLDPTYTVGTGATITTSGSDYSVPVTVTVTAPGGASRTWTVTAVEMKSPLIPGYYADPNIVRFGDTYYIYATTDGYAGWGGKDFYVWKSKNLVDWDRSAQPFLTLDGANGNVPWATGNAWAPTIIERGGKYYFYFSGHNPTYNRKTIGVAVADSPEGPFTAQPTAMILNNEAVTSGQAIDPAAFEDPATGKYYLFWGNGNPVYAELSDDMVSIKAGTIKAVSGLTSFREGSFVNERNGTYYLTYSIDDTGSPDYRVGYATAASVDGPWTYRGVILEKDPTQGILATGHSSIIQVPGTDDWYIAYHRFGMPGGDGTHRETTIDRLYFNDDGTIKKVVPTLSSVDPLTYEGATPLASVSHAGSDGWYGAGAALTLSGGDGVARLQYRIDGGDWADYADPVDLTAGTHAIGYRAQGTNLQWSAVQTLDVKVDDTPPAVQPTLDGRTVSLTATDADSGVASVEYRLDGGDWTTYAEPLVVDAYPHTVGYRASDVAGNASDVGTLDVPTTLDPAPIALKPPKVQGKTTVGSTLTATPGAWDQKGLVFSYQWLRDGDPIPGATAQKLRLGNGDVGHRMSVRVTARRSGALPGFAVSSPTDVVTTTSGTTAALWFVGGWS